MHEVVALAVEVGVREHPDRHVQVAGRATPGSGRAASREPEPLTGVDTAGDLDVDRATGTHASVAAAIAALRQDAPAGAVAHPARRCRDDLTQHRTTNLTHFTGTAAHVAARRMRSRLTSRAVASRARHGKTRLDRMRRPERGFRERQLDHCLGVGTARRTRWTSSGSEGITAEESLEDVAEPERVVRARPRSSTGAAVAEDVVATPAFGVAQRVVRDRHLLEALLGVGIVGVPVGMELAGEVAVRPSDVVVGRGARNAQDLVEVAGHERWRPSCCETAATAARAWG